MVDTQDSAGWYSDPTGNHELRYWDGYTWLDNVSDQGKTTSDPLGGKPLPPPSQVKPGAQAAAPPVAPSKSKTPVIIGAVVAAVVIIAAVAFFLTRGDDDD